MCFSVAFDVIEAGQAIVVLFDDGRVEEFLAIGIGGRLGHGPAGFGQLRTLQNEHGGPELDGGRGLGIVEDGEQGFQSAVAEMVEVVTAGEGEFGAGAVEGGDEGLAGLHPTVDGDAMDAVGFGGIGEGGTGGQGVDDALLDADEGRVVNGVSHFDDENSMGGGGGTGILGEVWFVFMGMRGFLGL